MDVTVHLEPEIALFYTRVAAANGKTLPQVLERAMFLLAGELSLEALKDRDLQKKKQEETDVSF